MVCGLWFVEVEVESVVQSSSHSLYSSLSQPYSHSFLSHTQTQIQQWRAKMKQLNRETEERNRLLLDEKHSIQRHYQQLKQRIKLYRSSQNQRLLQLSQSANQCKKALNEKLDFAR